MSTESKSNKSKIRHMKVFIFIILVAIDLTCMAQLKSQCPCSGGICVTSAAQNALGTVPAKTEAEAKKKIEAKLPLLLDFGAKQCIPCKKLAPILDELEKEYKGILTVKFIDVWVKENAAEAKKYEISSIPTQIFFDAEGRELWRHEGYISMEDILAKWKELGYDFAALKKAGTVKAKK
ncbi:MAG: thioredoxin family protein [Victivallaceae bacterium]|nr:thioredoxin family protein [Victivallaceae bacterium]